MAEAMDYWARAAVPLPDDAEFQAVAGEAHDPDTALNVVKMLAGTGDMFQPAVAMFKAVFAAEGVDPKLRQMAILRTSVMRGAPYKWQSNVILARNNGLTLEEIKAVASSGPVTGVAAEYQLACRAVDELTVKGDFADETLEALLDCFGPEVTRRLVLIICWGNLLSLFENGCRVPMEETNKLRGKTTPFG